MKRLTPIFAALCCFSISTPINAETATSLSKAEQAIFNQAFDAGAVATACEYLSKDQLNPVHYRQLVRKIINDGHSDPQVLLSVMYSGNGELVATMKPCAAEFKTVLNEQ